MSTAPRQPISWPKILVITAILCCITFFSFPKFNQPREAPGIISMGNNLRIIASAKEIWAEENKKQTNDVVTLSDLTEYFKHNKVPQPVAGETYLLDKVGDPALATLPPGKTYQGRPGPFTTTSF